MVRTPSFDKNGIKKGAWSPEEDAKLQAYIERYGHSNWRELPRFAGLHRCGKSCRLRWMNYLRPNIKRGGYTQEEEDLIIHLHQNHGNKWSMIARRLSGRTDNEVKNHWHTYLKKRCADNCHIKASNGDNASSDTTQSPQRHRGSSQGSRTNATRRSQVAADNECFRNIPILESSSLSSVPDVGATDGVEISDGFLFGSDFTPLNDLFDLSTITNYWATGTDHNTDVWTTPFTVEEMMSPYDVSSFFT